MKTAIYIENGEAQIVLTPETEFEKNALKEWGGMALAGEIKSGTFYKCQGGHTINALLAYQENWSSDNSLILRIAKEAG